MKQKYPSWSLLKDNGRYKHSYETDIAATFERIREEQAQAKPVVLPMRKVK